ncbi:MAG TPA: hypothetical protein PLD08_00730 [Acetomicrobium flavidum]|uniref:hypothetical protein n=1 Tax=Acetomicrobium flavidum TaxID=49896 RepID=UPI002CCBF25D|nr:hypothetical protein [Acetomicrobium flavidum]HPU68204.1 hypothetical protein [Acetomicrobium flavidum]
MEFHWHRSNQGDLWLSKDAVIALANTSMPSGYRAIDASLLGGEDIVNVVISTPFSMGEEDVKVESELKTKLARLFAPLGLKVQLSWAFKEEENVDFLGLMNKLKKRPIFWAFLVALVAGISQLGIKGLSLCILFGIIGWAVAKAVISGKLNDLISRLLNKGR